MGSVIYPVQMVSTTHYYLKALACGRLLESSRQVEPEFQGKERWMLGEEPPVAWVQLWVTWRSHPLPQNLPMRWHVISPQTQTMGQESSHKLSISPYLQVASSVRTHVFWLRNSSQHYLLLQFESYGFLLWLTWILVILIHKTALCEVRVIFVQGHQFSGEDFAPCRLPSPLSLPQSHWIETPYSFPMAHQRQPSSCALS